jgi:protein gp37
MAIWNPWHGCHKYSEGCKNCYVYRRDEMIGKDASIVEKTASFAEPVKRLRSGEYKLKSGTEIYACMTSDFFIEEADVWRSEIWDMIKQRSDIHFHIITKRITRAMVCLPKDWAAGYCNVTLGCTIENQKQAELRLPIFQKLPAKSKFIICEPLLEDIDLSRFLGSAIRYVSVGGESGPCARECNYDWVLHIRSQCIDSKVAFIFRQTGANFVKDGRRFKIPRNQQAIQAGRANIDI